MRAQVNPNRTNRLSQNVGVSSMNSFRVSSECRLFHEGSRTHRLQPSPDIMPMRAMPKKLAALFALEILIYPPQRFWRNAILDQFLLHLDELPAAFHATR